MAAPTPWPQTSLVNTNVSDQPVVAEGIAPELRRGNEAPFGKHGSRVERSWQQRQHIATSHAEIVIEFTRLLDVAAAPPLILEEMAAQAEHVTLGWFDRPGYALSVEKCAVGGSEVFDHELSVLDRHASVEPRDLSIGEHERLSDVAADRERLGTHLYTLIRLTVFAHDEVVPDGVGRRAGVRTRLGAGDSVLEISSDIVLLAPPSGGDAGAYATFGALATACKIDARAIRQAGSENGAHSRASVSRPHSDARRSNRRKTCAVMKARRRSRYGGRAE